MWDQIKAWYLQNGFTEAAANMEEIKQEWQGQTRHLLSALLRYKGGNNGGVSSR